jgi:serine/threonine protein kinase
LGLRLSEQEAKFIFKKVLLALKDLDDKGVLHRDIKNANILLTLPPDLMHKFVQPNGGASSAYPVGEQRWPNQPVNYSQF